MSKKQEQSAEETLRQLTEMAQERLVMIVYYDREDVYEVEMGTHNWEWFPDYSSDHFSDLPVEHRQPMVCHGQAQD